ncbi:MAG: ABC transporter ATP-binding protein [Magnetococcales bacterium]|nr:ABC transporter ATP-binding protein [Magnetococcales bacterium]
MSAAMISVTGLHKVYPRHHALRGLNLEVPPGICLALLGHNGAGKSTLMKILLGVTRGTSGSVRVLGVEPGRSGLDFRRQLGFLPENVAFYEEMTGVETLNYFARLKGIPRQRGLELLARVGIEHAAGRRVKTFSKGMRQRLGLAQALLGEPRLLLLDEPTTGLDPMLRLEFFRIIRELVDNGTTVLLSSHILTELEARTDRVAILREGRLVAHGTLEELRHRAGLSARLILFPGRDSGGLAAFCLAWQGRMLPSGAWELHIAEDRKMEAIRCMASLGDQVQDFELVLPTLDDVYAHFGHGKHFLALEGT